MTKWWIIVLRLAAITVMSNNYEDKSIRRVKSLYFYYNLYENKNDNIKLLS